MMWKRVDFPEPEGPMMARNSPACTCRLTPRSASTSTFPMRYVLQRSCVSMAKPLLIRQGLDGIVPGGAQSGVQRAQSRADEGDGAGDGPPEGHDIDRQ